MTNWAEYMHSFPLLIPGTLGLLCLEALYVLLEET